MPPGQKGFQKGHAHLVAKAARALASEVRAKFPADLMVDWYTAIAMGKSPVVVIDEDGEKAIAWQESGGVIPDAARMDAAVSWLANRGHGQAAQLLQVEQTTRLELTTSALQLGALSPAALLAVRDALRLSAPAGEVIDAASTELGRDSGAPADDTNASDPQGDGET